MDDQNYRLLRAKVFLERLYDFFHELKITPAAQDTALIMIAATTEIIDAAMSANENMHRAFKLSEKEGLTQPR